MTTHPSQILGSGMHRMSPESSGWSGSEQMPSGYNDGSPSDTKSPDFQQMGLITGFPAMQKKVTRDGQPAKRRGPKPDSKPAQTRRQELNRQAQRTHRERKEQYIKALETEVARLREAFVHETNSVQNQLKQQEVLLHEQRQENFALRDILASRGIPFEAELQSRKANIRLPTQTATAVSPGYSTGQGSHYGPVMTGSSSSVGFSGIRDHTFTNGTTGSVTGHSPGTTHHSHSPPVPDVHEQAARESSLPISDMPGIFEKDPQLGVDFILALEATCRDHGEYLVRRSMNSPNDPEEALFSGHALMATCPPPSHIETTPAQKEGLEPTYPHQTPQVPMQTLNTLLNLSQMIKSAGFVEGGQVTPIMALQSLRGHRNYHSLNRDDVVGMVETIKNKVRCYGFGAVMEDFELRDALSSIFATKPETYESYGNDMTAEIEEMYS